MASGSCIVWTLLKIWWVCNNVQQESDQWFLFSKKGYHAYFEVKLADQDVTKYLKNMSYASWLGVFKFCLSLALRWFAKSHIDEAFSRNFWPQQEEQKIENYSCLNSSATLQWNHLLFIGFMSNDIQEWYHDDANPFIDTGENDKEKHMDNQELTSETLQFDPEEPSDLMSVWKILALTLKRSTSVTFLSEERCWIFLLL